MLAECKLVDRVRGVLQLQLQRIAAPVKHGCRMPISGSIILKQCRMAAQLVNVQSNSEFASHMLNRDVWRDETVKNIIKVGFVLYQVRTLSYWCPASCYCTACAGISLSAFLWAIRPQSSRLEDAEH